MDKSLWSGQKLIENRTILIGDVLEKLKEIPDESFDVEISSPPYWGLRDYGVEGQWGLEKDFREYLNKLDQLMVELKRVLKKTGTCWINLGDTYSGGYNHSDWQGTDESFDKKRKNQKYSAQRKNHLEAKSRYGIPERFYINCIDNGWIARNHIIWYKSNAMPSSIKDRFTNHWESIFFFAKNQKYYFNLDAVREKPLTETKPFNLRVREAKKGRGQLKLGDDPKAYKMADWEDDDYNRYGVRVGRRTNDEKLNNRNFLPNKQDSTPKANGKPDPTKKGFNERWKYREVDGEPDSQRTLKERIAYARRVEGKDHDACLNNPNGKNPGDVFFINPTPLPEDHFATFPIELPLKILKCACPKDGMVLDPFFGAGTVGIAAEMLGLNWCGIELKKEYTEIALKRLLPYKNEKIENFVK